MALCWQRRRRGSCSGVSSSPTRSTWSGRVLIAYAQDALWASLHRLRPGRALGETSVSRSPTARQRVVELTKHGYAAFAA